MDQYERWLERRKEREACMMLIKAESDALYEAEKLLKARNPNSLQLVGYAADAMRDAVQLLKDRDAADLDPRMLREYGPAEAL